MGFANARCSKTARRPLLGVLVVGLVSLVGAAVFAPESSAAGPAVAVEVVVDNPSYSILAVDSTGMTYGLSVANENEIWRSADHGVTWSKVLTLPTNQHVKAISALASGTVLAHVDTGAMTLLRSADQGTTWTSVLSLPTTPVFYTTLTPHSITDGGGYVWLGTYNTGQTPPYSNYLYRSADDGATWSIVNTTSTHRHIHGVRYHAASGKLYVFFGDSDGDGIWVSSDNGATLQPLCTDLRVHHDRRGVRSDGLVHAVRAGQLRRRRTGS